MKILALDSATNACSAALWVDGEVIARRFEPMARGQAERLMPMIEEVMSEAGAAYADLDRVAVTVGPGAFTGLRLGLASARGIALAAAVPCIGVTTLEAVAAGVPDGEGLDTIWVVLETKRQDFYVQRFDLSDGGMRAVGEAMALPISEWVAVLKKGSEDGIALVGNAAARASEALAEFDIASRLIDAPGQPDAAIVAARAADRPMPSADSPPPGPIYLRPPDAIPGKASPRERR